MEKKTQKEQDFFSTSKKKKIMSEAWFGVQYALFEYMDPIKIGMDYVSLVGKLHVQK